MATVILAYQLQGVAKLRQSVGTPSSHPHPIGRGTLLLTPFRASKTPSRRMSLQVASPHPGEAQPTRKMWLLQRQGWLPTALHVAAFSQLGVLLRFVLGEAFGGRCDERLPGEALARWGACVTLDGTRGVGGALFKDLPANMVGCFVMGLLSAAAALRETYSGAAAGGGEPALALFSARSSLQRHESAQVGLRTGFCGSLTTFASWELQMVVMLVAGSPTKLDSQWLAVISGLILGTQAALASLTAGQHLGVAFLNWHARNFREVEHVEEGLADAKADSALVSPGRGRAYSRLSCVVLVSLMCITGLSVWGTLSLDKNPFWRKVCVSMLFGPFGALLRWQLGKLNSVLKGQFEWFPLGTWTANMVACAVSFVTHGIVVSSGFLSTTESLLATGIKSGFGGSLSTVSTWVVEIQKLMKRHGNNYNGYVYILLSHVGAILLGVAAYAWGAWQ